MKHPVLLLIPALMISDYLLTVAGARLRTAAFGNHFKTQHYELNPLWQNAIARLRWFNLRHLALTLLVTGALIIIWEWSDPDDPLLPYFIGFLIGAQGTIIGRHLGNLAAFAYVKRHLGEIGGTVTMSHGLALWLSTFQLYAVLLPLALLAAYSPQQEVLGAVAGVVALILVHMIWIARHRRKLRLLQQSPDTQEAARLHVDASASPPTQTHTSRTN